jgi:hypothetical protein
VETAIHDNAATRSVKVVAAHQLKSGDIQIFTSTTTEATHLKDNKGWLRGLGEHAELIVPTYGVIVHGISTHSINIKEQEATIQQMLADNYTVIPSAKIAYVGWLTKEATLKRASSAVVEFTDPEMANAIIYAGMAWDGQIHQCQLYDRACRVKQCFRCYNYGHIGTQCNTSQVCGYCAEQHETKHCKQKGMEGFNPRCAVCKGAHTAWSNACPARKKEMARVEQAKQVRSIYWHVPAKENTASTRTRNTHNPNARREGPLAPGPDLIAAQGAEEAREHTAPGGSNPAHTEHQVPPPTSRPTEPIVQSPLQTETEVQTPEAITTQAPTAMSVEEWETPQQEPAQQLDLPIDPRIIAMEETLSTIQVLEDGQSQPPLYPADGAEGTSAMQDADAWLDNMIDNEWLYGTAEVEPSPPTSMATDPRTALGAIYKACKCPSHQEIYSDWPTQDAELTIATCMKICMYCGKDFAVTAELRKHLRKRVEYIRRNLRVQQETRGKYSSSTPSWTRIEAPTRRRNGRTTRSRSHTNSANAGTPP